MCGIAGILNLTERPVNETAVRAMTRALAHRGPDGEGFYLQGAIGLGHRRLAILDLSSSGQQPLSYAEGRYQITYNGEIYNFLELRAELSCAGYVFRTETDTEVILAAYDRWGAECQLKFNGMWALAIWDERERTLFLSRDRFGVKPLFYLAEPQRFVFASELKAFRQLNDFTLRENETALRRAIAIPARLEASSETPLEGVQRLPGGHCLLVNHTGVKLQRWWRTLDHLASVPATLSAQAEQFRALFFDACRLRLRSDVPVATCLSGGVDSSAVLCTLAQINTENGDLRARRATQWQRAFVATFPGTASDEQRFAEIAVRHAGAEARYRPMSSALALDELEQIIFDLEEIAGTLPAPMWGIYRELRRDSVTVSLDGHGADEMLGGYTHYAQTALRAAGGVLLHPKRTLDLADTLHNLYDPTGPVAAPSRLKLVLANDPLLRRLRSWFKHQQTADVPDAEEKEIAALGPLNAQLYRDFHGTMLPAILRNFDRCSMAHGVEVRMPFLDWRLVCFVFALPAESKIGGGFTKRVLREAMRGVMPETLRTRKGKLGFNSPLPEWFSGPLREWLRAQVNEQDFLQSPFWNGPAIRALVENKGANAWTWHECERLWPGLHAHLWRKIFLRR